MLWWIVDLFLDGDWSELLGFVFVIAAIVALILLTTAG
jgi:hypothetical protein